MPTTEGGAVGPTLLVGLPQGGKSFSHLGSLEVVKMLKNMKPPMFRMEKWERNIDAINTFLQEWSDLHALPGTLDSISAIEASLTLEGKA